MVGRIEKKICPVKAMLAFLAVKGFQKRPSLLFQRWHLVIKAIVCKETTGNLVCSGSGLLSLLWPFIPDWSGHCCGGQGSSRVNNPDIGEME